MLQLQQDFVDLRFGMFLHFNMATFQDREWGNPSDDPSVFNPAHLDTDQWAEAAKSAGMTYGCLTTKHHDGFCIWPTKSGVAHASMDVVKAYVESFRKAGLQVALYYSILDMRNDVRHFNITPAKIQLIKDQLTELLTNYGEINHLIIDGWDAPWSRITYEEIPFHEIYALIKSLQPNCLVSDLNASEYPSGGLYYSDVKAYEQNAGQTVPEESDLPAYSCVTLTDGWFWKQADKDAELKSVRQVVDEWLVPLNRRHCNLILNAAPNRGGRLAPNVVRRLEEIGKAWKREQLSRGIGPNVVITTSNLATGKVIHASSYPDTVGPDQANDGSFGSTWRPDNTHEPAWLEVDLGVETAFNTLVLVEPVGRWNDYRESRIKNWRWQERRGSSWVDIAEGDKSKPVEARRIDRTQARFVRVTFDHASPDREAHIAEVGIYNEP